tara:strand:- start:365 stop:760 length:396 start_codon:yes stop_codon:yes gene_type:complete
MYNVTSALQSHLHEITEKITSNNFADSLDCTDVRMGISHMEKTLRSIRSNLNGSEENDLNLLMEDFDMTVLLKNLERTTRHGQTLLIVDMGKAILFVRLAFFALCYCLNAVICIILIFANHQVSAECFGEE